MFCIIEGTKFLADCFLRPGQNRKTEPKLCFYNILVKKKGGIFPPFFTFFHLCKARTSPSCFARVAFIFIIYRPSVFGVVFPPFSPFSRDFIFSGVFDGETGSCSNPLYHVLSTLSRGYLPPRAAHYNPSLPIVKMQAVVFTKAA